MALSIIRATFAAVLCCLPACAQPIAVSASPPRVSSARRAFVPVLIYHHVKWLKPSDNQIERGLTVLPSEFENQLRYLTSAHYHVVTASQLAAYLDGRSGLPRQPVVLTFDDGYIDMYPYAYAALRRHHMRATFFIVPGFVGTGRYLSWKQVRTMSTHGMDIEAHSMTHPDLPTISTSRIEGEVRDSRRVLEARLHRPVPVFAYPYGDYDNRVLSALRGAGFRAAFTTEPGWWQSNVSPLRLPRVYIDIDDTAVIFRGRLMADPAVLAEDPT